MTAADRSPTLPYIGLRPFDEADQRLYFGREGQINEVLGLLEEGGFLAIVGSSGSGKSSLVRAGVLPLVREGFLLGRRRWQIVLSKPGAKPYESLARALSRSAVTSATSFIDERASIEALQSLLRTEAQPLHKAQASCGFGADDGFLVVIDQFEELFAYRHGVASHGGAPRDEAAAFVRMLLRSCADARGPVRVMITMRSDFIGHSEAFLGLPEAISRGQFLVPRLDRSQMECAIIGPSTLEGDGLRPFSFEAGVVNRVVNDAGDRPDQLPLLQHALMQTWKQARSRNSSSEGICLELVDYEQVGGVAGALAQHADAALNELDGDVAAQSVARSLFLLLAEVSSEGQLTRRRPTLAEIEITGGVPRLVVKNVVHAFQRDDRNFVLPDADELNDDAVSLDISHESLLRRWPTFQKWAASEAEAVAMFVGLRDRSQRYPEKEALLPDPALAVAMAWCDSFQPTDGWAARYGGGLSSLRHYLSASLRARDDALAAKALEQAQRLADAQLRTDEQARAARRYRLLTFLMAAALIVTLLLGGYVFVQQRRALALQAKVDEMAAQRDALNAQRAALQLDLTTLSEKRSALEAQAATLEAERKALFVGNAAMLAVAGANGTVLTLPDDGLEVHFSADPRQYGWTGAHAQARVTLPSCEAKRRRAAAGGRSNAESTFCRA